MYRESVGNHFPTLYRGFEEIDQLVIAEDALFTELITETGRFRANQFANTAYLEGVQELEKILNILASPSTETLEFRRARIINRFSQQPPFSLPFLRKKLDEIIGVGAYTATMNYATYTLTVQSLAENQSWAHEILITINRVKPANIVYINNPVANVAVNVSEQIRTADRIYNYKLGTDWALGQKTFGGIFIPVTLTYNCRLGTTWQLGTPFLLEDPQEVVKLSSIFSLDANMLHELASQAAGVVVKVLLNNSVAITSFEVKYAAAGTAIISYEVPAGAVAEITNIKLLDDEDNTLTNSNVYVPIISDVLIMHNIYVREGE